MVSVQTFRFRYGVFKPLLWALGAGPRASSIAVDAESLRVRMGWMFRAEVPRGSITGARTHSGFVGGIGIHGWGGRWLVNGGIRGIVVITIDPPARARVLGVRVRLRELAVSVESPDGLIAALTDGGVEGHRQHD